MIENAIRAARLDVDFYNTIEHDKSYTGQAAIVVIIVNVLSGIGTFWSLGGNFFGAVIGGAVGGIIGWLIWAGITQFVGTRLFEGTAEYDEMLRVLGFAQAPRALGIIPYLGFVALIWSLIASVIAVREGLDFDTGKAIITVIVGWLAFVVLAIIWAIIF